MFPVMWDTALEKIGNFGNFDWTVFGTSLLFRCKTNYWQT